MQNPADSALVSLDVRHISFSSALDAAMPDGAHAQLLLSGDDRYDCLLLAQHIEGGSAGPARHKHRVDQYYIVLSGVLTIDLAGDVRDVEAGTLVVVPAGMGHTTFNRSAQSEYHIELFVPDQPLTTLSTPAEPRDGDTLEARMAPLSSGKGFASKSAAFHMMSLEDAPQAIAAGQDDLIVIVLAGAMDAESDGVSACVARHDMIVLPAGTALSARSAGAQASLLLIGLTKTPAPLLAEAGGTERMN